jgi:hypothetical protein
MNRPVDPKEEAALEPPSDTRGRSARGRWPALGAAARSCLYVAAACALLLAVFELTARWYRPTPPLPSFYEIGWSAKQSPYRLQPTTDASYAKDDGAELNQLALRGRPFSRHADDRTRVLLLGDSQVEAAAEPFHDMPEALLERMLGQEFNGRSFEVRTIGAGGWGQDQQLLALRRFFAEFSTDYVLLWYTLGNDFWENAFPDRSTSVRLGMLKPTFVLGPNGLDEFDFAPYKSDGPGMLGDLHLYRRAYRMAESSGLIGEARLLGDFKELIPGTAGHKAVPRERCPAAIVDQAVYSINRSAYGYVPVSLETDEAFLESRSHFTPFLKELSERDKYTMNVTRALVAEIGRLAQVNGSRLIVFFSNQSYRDGTHRFVKGSCVAQSGYWYELVDAAERTKEALADLDVLGLMRAHADVSFDEVTISRRDRHLNRRGNELVFGELIELLKAKGLMSQSPRDGAD